MKKIEEGGGHVCIGRLRTEKLTAPDGRAKKMEF